MYNLHTLVSFKSFVRANNMILDLRLETKFFKKCSYNAGRCTHTTNYLLKLK